ncbi:MAG: hypothetical protein HQL09_07090 [Nitrospirae bacterium]|nr:hypothetical protein [Nitrospirota bacterium]
MVDYIDGLSWAAINVCNLKFPPEHVSSYYMLASVMIIASILALMIPENKKQ